MPRNSDFPDYQGIKVDHVNGWNAIDYHKPKSTQPNPNVSREGMGDVKGMVSPRKRRVHNDNPSQETIDKTTRAAREDWRNRGLSNNEIKDY